MSQLSESCLRETLVWAGEIAEGGARVGAAPSARAKKAATWGRAGISSKISLQAAAAACLHTYIACLLFRLRRSSFLCGQAPFRCSRGGQASPLCGSQDRAEIESRTFGWAIASSSKLATAGSCYDTIYYLLNHLRRCLQLGKWCKRAPLNVW